VNLLFQLKFAGDAGLEPRRIGMSLRSTHDPYSVIERVFCDIFEVSVCVEPIVHNSSDGNAVEFK